jgi:TetR/AcrR family transcriptional repressor of lmrAB and yxaGH operons
MIETTARLLQHRGYHGVSLNDVLSEAEAPRGSLYFHFPDGKDQLVLEATRAGVDRATEFLRATLAASSTPAAGVRAFVEETARLMEASDYTFGCPVAPLVLDDAGHAAELAALCRQAFDDWTGEIREALVSAGVPAARAKALATMVEAAHEGSFIMARANRNVVDMMTVARELETMLQAALPDPMNR